MVQVKINDGVLEGEYLDNEYGGKYYSFRGIPYAAPPIGNLRFKAPQPVTPWEGVRKATEHGPKCFQAMDPMTGQFTPLGSEDCLYINVYTPKVKPDKPLPVMVFIHGGAFMYGSGNDDLYGPEFLVRHEVILVTLNYRIGVLGFLCLDTEEIPGNAGMKDQVAALKWVKNNITHFGGDPNKITIFGESAGGASVSFHLISPMSKGLFRRAIAQSGAACNSWAMPFQPRERGLVLARNLGLNSDDDIEVNNFFKTVPVMSLCTPELAITTSETQKNGLSFGVVSEKKFGNNERFFFGDIFEALRNIVHDDVEVINGYTEDEGLLMMTSPISELCSKINKYADYLAPKEVKINCTLADQIEASKSLKTFYFGNELATEENWNILKEILDFDNFAYGVLQFAKYCVFQKRKTYLYRFTCKSERNRLADLLGLRKLIGDKEVAGHGDDLFYLFPGKVMNHKPLNDSTKKAIDNITKLWTNFAKCGNPTPDKSLGVKWAPYTMETQQYLNIGNSLSMEAQPDKEEAEFWENLHRKYVPNQVLPLAYAKMQNKKKCSFL